MKNTNKKGFTLVELIIVITILAILATIAFMSFQSYSADARNAKRKSDIDNIVKSIDMKSTQGVSLLNFVTGNGSRLSAGSIAGNNVASLYGTAYEAGDVNLTILGLNNQFKDGNNSYKIGVTTKAGGQYEVAGKMESDSTASNLTAFVKGTFIPRKSSENGVGYFKVGDILASGLEVIKVSPDLETLTLSDNSTISAAGAYLSADDVLGLISSVSSSATEVTNGGTNLPY